MHHRKEGLDHLGDPLQETGRLRCWRRRSSILAALVGGLRGGHMSKYLLTESSLSYNMRIIKGVCVGANCNVYRCLCFGGLARLVERAVAKSDT